MGIPSRQARLASPNLTYNYLDTLGCTTIFNNYLPDKDFVRGFMARHPCLTVQPSNMTKRSRAGLSKEDVTASIKNFMVCAEIVSPEIMYHSDTIPKFNRNF
jgi:hypothetical protein